MRTSGKLILAGLVVLAALAGGCGDDTKCASESPQVDTLATSCEAVPGAEVHFPLRLCPTCNQNLTGCTVDMHDANASSGTIFLNPVAEACDTSNSCGPSCQTNPAICTFKPPGTAVGANWTVLVYDPGISTTKQGHLTIVSDSPSCGL